MASIQDIETRLQVVEHKLAFIMNSQRMKATVSSGLVGPNGIPVPSRVFEGSLLELYHLSNQVPTIKESDVPIPPPIDEGEVE